jgi:hypothetical protein
MFALPGVHNAKGEHVFAYDPTFAQELLDSLSGGNARKRLADRHHSIFDEAEEDPAGEYEFDPENNVHPSRSLVLKNAFLRNWGTLASDFCKLATTLADHPEIITAEDLCEAFMRHLRVTPSAFDVAYEQFLGDLDVNYLCPRASAPFAVACDPTYEARQLAACIRSSEDSLPDLPHVHAADKQGSPGDFVLWENNGVHICMLGLAPGPVQDAELCRGELPCTTRVLTAQVCGIMSMRACHSLMKELSDLMPSLIRSSRDYCEGTCLPGLTMQRLPTVGNLDLEGTVTARFMKLWLDSYFAPKSKPKRNALDWRVRNALHLLVESDSQSDDAVGLSLCVCALEALLAQKGVEISGALADNIATFLEPELCYRAAAVGFVKRLYNVRSEVLHGECVESERETRVNARRLAAAVLRAVVKRREVMKEASLGTETLDDLLDDLRKSKYTPGPILGADPCTVCDLWRKNFADA